MCTEKRENVFAEAFCHNLVRGGGVGVCTVKSLGAERWGTLTGSLWAEESHINWAAAITLNGLWSAVPCEIPDFSWTTKHLSSVLFSQNKCWASSQKVKVGVSAPYPIRQKHVCRYFSNGLSLKTWRMAQRWQNICQLSLKCCEPQFKVVHYSKWQPV